MNTFQLPSAIAQAMKNMEQTQSFASSVFAKNQSLFASLEQASKIMEKFAPALRQYDSFMKSSKILESLELSSKIAEKFRPIVEQQQVFLKTNGLLEAFQRTQEILNRLHPEINENDLRIEDTDIPNEISIPFDKIHNIFEDVQNSNDNEALHLLSRSILPVINNLLRSLLSISIPRDIKLFLLGVLITHVYYIQGINSAAQDRQERKEEHEKIVTEINAHTDSVSNTQKQLIDSLILIDALIADEYITKAKCNVYSSSNSKKVVYKLKKETSIYVKGNEGKRLHIIYISEGIQVDGWIYKQDAEKKGMKRRKSGKKYKANTKTTVEPPRD